MSAAYVLLTLILTCEKQLNLFARKLSLLMILVVGKLISRSSPASWVCHQLGFLLVDVLTSKSAAVSRRRHGVLRQRSTTCSCRNDASLTINVEDIVLTIRPDLFNGTLKLIGPNLLWSSLVSADRQPSSFNEKNATLRMNQWLVLWQEVFTS